MFPYEEMSHKWLMVAILALSCILAIVINQTDLSGKRKMAIFRLVFNSGVIVLVPAGLYLLLVNSWGVASTEYLTVANSLSRFVNAACGLALILIASFRLIPVAKQGMSDYKRKSITASKYQRTFKSLRAAYIANIIVIIFCYWINYMFHV